MNVAVGLDGWEREFPVGYWTVDVAVPELRFAAQADGDFWHGRVKPEGGYEDYVADTRKRDKACNTYMRNHGWVQIRCWEGDLMTDPEACLGRLRRGLAKARRQMVAEASDQ